MPLGNTKSNLGIFGEKIKGKAGSSKSQRRLQRNNWDCIRLGERPGRPGREGNLKGNNHIPSHRRSGQTLTKYFLLLLNISSQVTNLVKLIVTTVFHMTSHPSSDCLVVLFASVQDVCLSSGSLCGSAQVVRDDRPTQLICISDIYFCKKKIWSS